MLSFNMNSGLYSQDTFYKAFQRDLSRAKSLVIIESPFITQRRVACLLPVIEKLKRRGVRVVVNTKPISEHDSTMANQAGVAIGALQEMGVIVLMTIGHHRKLAIIDDILYEGSLNILSQNDSCELMRRIDDASSVQEMLRFIKLEKWCK
jgi:hypothetical protein